MIFEDIQAFVNVARYGGFGRAANSMSIAQSALSKRVKRLEQRVGKQLIERSPRGIELSEAGVTLLKESQDLVEKIEDLERNISSYVLTPTGRVRVAMPLRTCAQVAPGLLRRCREELPLVSLEINEGTPGDVHSMMASGNSDLALLYHNGDYGFDFDVLPLMSEPLYLIMPKSMAESNPDLNPCKIQDLAQIPLILPPRPSSLRALVERLCQGHGTRPNIIYEVAGTNTIRALVAGGMGATIFSQSVWSSITEAELLCRIPFSSPMMSWKLLRVRRRGNAELIAVNRVSSIIEEEFVKLFHQGAWPGGKLIISG